MLKKRRKLVIIVGSVSLVFIFSLVSTIKEYINKSEIVFFDIGQGDSTLIKLPNNKLILIDGGPDNLVVNRIGHYLPYYQRQIDYIILSHYHDDHIMGLIEIMNRYQVNTLIYMEGSKNSDLLQHLVKRAQLKGVKTLALKNKLDIEYSANCLIKVLSPLAYNINADDNNSLFVSLNCNGLRGIFNGDSDIMVEKALINSGENIKTDIFKASHHGSKTANSEEFLDLMKPTYFIISSGKNNRFGHPNLEVIERVRDLKINIKRTDQEGNIILSK